MACLETPLTVIGGGSGKDDLDLDSADARFSPPAATWYDECHEHFVALLEQRKRRGSEDAFSISLAPDLPPTRRGKGGTDGATGYVAYYQTLSMPRRHSAGFQPDFTGDGGGDAFEEVLNKFKGERQSLVGSSPVSVMLPRDLASQPPEEGQSPASPGLRVPTLAKFSLGSQFIALQFTETLVRIARVAEGDRVDLGGSFAAQQKQWTIDLSVDSLPVSTAARSMPPPRRPTRRDKQTFRRAGSFAGSSAKDDGVIPGETKILPGGVIWSDHGGNSEDLVLVTTTAVLFYKISMARNHMAKSRAYPHPFVAGFWFEPKARALMVGSYIVQKHCTLDGAAGAGVPSARDSQSGSVDEATDGPSMVMVMRTYFLNGSPKRERSDSSSSSLSSPPSPSTSFGGGGESRGPGIVNASYYSFPRFELPPPKRLQPFVVGAQRNTAGDSGDLESVHENEQSGESRRSREQVVSLDDIHLVNVYGDVYCVELGCLGGVGVGINLYHLDKVGGRVCVKQIIPQTFQMPRSQPGFNFVSTLDNLICVHSKCTRMSLFLDVADTSDIEASEDASRIVISEECSDSDSIFDESFSFLPPCFLLNPEGRGHLHRMVLDLPLLLKAMPPSRAALPLLLRRRSSPAVAHALALRHLNEIVVKTFFSSGDEDSMELKIWIDSIVDCYASNERSATSWDLEACHPLIFKAAVLKASSSSQPNEPVHDSDLFSICSRTPSSCNSVLTQSELLEGLLIPRATVAISAMDMQMLRYILDLSVLFLGAFEERSVMPCPALECFIVALSWRLGDILEVNSLLCSRKVYRARHNKKLDQIGDKEVEGEQKEAPGLEKAMNVGIEMFAEMLLMLSKEKVVSSCSGGSSSKKQLRVSLVTHAIDLLCHAGSYQLAAKHLLAMNRVMDAMAVCSKAISPHSLHPSASQEHPRQSSLPSNGMRADDFFRAAVNKASTLPGIGDRARLFFFMHTFIKQYDPESLRLESYPINAALIKQGSSFASGTGAHQMFADPPQRRSSFASGAGAPHNSVARRRSSTASRSSCSSVDTFEDHGNEIQQSILAHNCAQFPDHLFGGRESDICRQLREMFGFQD